MTHELESCIVIRSCLFHDSSVNKRIVKLCKIIAAINFVLNYSFDQPTQTTPATSCEPQLWLPQPSFEQRSIEVSFPVHSTSSNTKLPLPEPNRDLRSADLAPL